MEEWVDELKRMLIVKRAGEGSKLMKIDQRSRLDLSANKSFFRQNPAIGPKTCVLMAAITYHNMEPKHLKSEVGVLVAWAEGTIRPRHQKRVG